MEKEWILTDGSTGQKGRGIDYFTWEYSEEGCTGDVCLLDYSYKEIEDCITAYGYSLKDKEGFDNIRDLYGKDANQIICECLWETYVLFDLKS